jgi:hypothetical protein
MSAWGKLGRRVYGTALAVMMISLLVGVASYALGFKTVAAFALVALWVGAGACLMTVAVAVLRDVWGRHE